VPATVLLGCVAAFACIGVSSAASAPSHVPVYFLRGEQLASVQRTGTTPLDAMRQLIAGPTPAEFKQGFRTYMPTRTRVLGVRVANGVATVDLNERFASGSNSDSLLARLSQVVRTLTGVQGVKKIQLLMNGGIIAARFPGISLSRPITLRFLQTPNVPLPKPVQLRLPPPDPAVQAIQQRLIELGYLVKGDDDGRFGPATQNAILAFQKWERLGRTGLLDAATKARLAAATHPAPLSRGASGKRAEILLDRQVALLIDNDQVVRAIPVSTGKPSTPTPPGDYRVGLRANQIEVVYRSGNTGLVSATVKLAEINGSETYVHARHHDFTMIAQLEGVREFALGESVSLHFDSNRLFVFDGAGNLAAAPARPTDNAGAS